MNSEQWRKFLREKNLTQLEIKKKLKEDDIIWFTEKILGFALPKFQKEFLLALNDLDANQNIAICWPRQHGKSLMLCIAGLWYAIRNPNSLQILFGFKMAQAKELLRRVKDLIKISPLTRDLIPSYKEGEWSKSGIELPNGARILTRASSDSARGLTCDRVMVDEAGDIDDPSFFTGTLTPLTAVSREGKGGQTVLSGTPRPVINFWADKIQKKPDGWWVRHYRAIIDKNNKEILFPGLWSWDKLMNEWAKQGPDAFLREYQTNFINITDMFFTNPEEHATDRYEIAKTKRPSARYYIGHDPAEKRDEEVWVVLEQSEPSFKKLHVCWIEVHKGLEAPDRVKIAEELCTIFKPMKYVMDSTGLGVETESLFRSKGIPVTPFRFGFQSKWKLFSELRDGFERKQLEIPHDPKLIEQLKGIGTKKTPSGRVVIDSYTKNDDHATALALAWWGTTEIGNSLIVTSAQGWK